ncbi:G-patch domain and KOW motifs-containing protein [Stomoxys calcitrans]|uniref:G-patch domain and KOW motifs-containing protein n=1 Tax=Stomoxys calcitrans TaxID=35570 RepID=UPI0027E2B339|nr:G-patch domain and KOW motifs-containing protein [Stomoxys calcitrans]
MDPTKKISFGFSKVNKKINLFTNKEPPKANNGVELIKCLEGQEIKLVQEKQEQAALVIPLKENQKTSAALASLIKRRAVLLGEDEPETNIKQDNGAAVDIKTAIDSDDIEKRAAKELLAELNANTAAVNSESLVLPVVHPDDLPLDGAKESSMDDYESIPIQEFGKAMLRGMGWVEPPKPTKGGPPVDEMPSVRPKGMGLGADKALKAKPLLVAPESNEVLEIKRNAYVRILGGKHKDLYGQIEGFDDHAGRVIVKMAIGGAKEAFNEFLCQPVARKEYAQYGKCINTTKYEEYKRKENEHGQIVWKEEANTQKIKKENSDSPKAAYQKTEDSNKKIQEISSDEEDDKRNVSKGNGCEKRHNKEYNRKKEDPKSHSCEKERHDKYSSLSDKGYEKERFRDDSKSSSSYNKYRDKEEEKYRTKYSDKFEERPTVSRRDDYRRKEDTDGKYYRDESRQRINKHYDSDNSRRDQSNRERRKDYDDTKIHQIKPLKSEDDSDREGRNKHKKSKKKSKKTKKSKSSKYDSTDTESSSSTSSDSEEERHKRHKKKTKKSKKQRERSRSRGRK